MNFYTQVLDQLRQNPMVKYAATGAAPIDGGAGRAVYAVFGEAIPPVAQRPVAFINTVSEDYFTALKIPIREGRAFQSTDIDGAPQVAIISESFAKRLFPHESAIGKVLLRGQQADLRLEIVGVIADIKAAGLNTPPPDMLFQALRQAGGAFQTLMAYTDGDPAALQSALRGAVAAVDKTQAVSFFATLDTQLSQTLGVQRITAWLTGAFSIVALFLSALGLYSVLAYAVTQRTGEIGIRMALGAERTDVIRLIVSQGMRLVVIGLVIGLAVAAAGGRALSTLLFNVKPLDPLVFGGVTLLFAFVAVLACLVPSWRASQIEALVALRTD